MCKEIIKIKLRPKMFVEIEFDTRPTSKDRPKLESRPGKARFYSWHTRYVCIVIYVVLYIFIFREDVDT